MIFINSDSWFNVIKMIPNMYIMYTLCISYSVYIQYIIYSTVQNNL